MSETMTSEPTGEAGGEGMAVATRAKAALDSTTAPNAFANVGGYRVAKGMAADLAAAGDLVPPTYRNNPGACMIAIDLASRLGVSPMTVIQNLYIVEGKPTWASQFLIAAVGSSGRFSDIRWEEVGEVAKPGWKVRAYATDLRNGDVLYGTWITHELVTKEGWYTRGKSKWASMPEQMIRYRSATFWARTFAPALTAGLPMRDEVEDVSGSVVARVQSRAADLTERLAATQEVKAISAPREQSEAEIMEEIRRDDARNARADLDDDRGGRLP